MILQNFNRSFAGRSSPFSSVPFGTANAPARTFLKQRITSPRTREASITESFIERVTGFSGKKSEEDNNKPELAGEYVHINETLIGENLVSDNFQYCEAVIVKLPDKRYALCHIESQAAEQVFKEKVGPYLNKDGVKFILCPNYGARYNSGIQPFGLFAEKQIKAQATLKNIQEYLLENGAAQESALINVDQQYLTVNPEGVFKGKKKILDQEFQTL